MEESDSTNEAIRNAYHINFEGLDKAGITALVFDHPYFLIQLM